MPGKPARILSIICPSNYPNFLADSIYIFNRILINALLTSEPELQIIVAGPHDMPVIHPKVEFIRMRLGLSKFEARLGFQWEEARALLKEARPDFCLVNMPEQAGALAVLIKDDLRLPCKVISYIHYLPAMPRDNTMDEVSYENSINENGNGPVLLARLLEGIIASDMVFIGSQFGLRLLSKVGAQILKWHVDLAKIRILPPPVDFDEVLTKTNQPISDVPRFVYNHRLYNEYGTHHIFELLKSIYRDGDDPFEILVTNPTEGRNSERARLNPAVDQNLALIRELPFVQVQHFRDRNSYIHALSNSWAGLAPYKPHALWSMSVIDMLACGRPVLSFDIAAFKEMGIPEDLLVRNDDEFIRVFCRLMSSKTQNSQQRYRSIAERFSGQSIAQRFIEFIRQL